MNICVLCAKKYPIPAINYASHITTLSSCQTNTTVYTLKIDLQIDRPAKQKRSSVCVPTVRWFDILLTFPSLGINAAFSLISKSRPNCVRNEIACLQRNHFQFFWKKLKQRFSCSTTRQCYKYILYAKCQSSMKKFNSILIHLSFKLNWLHKSCITFYGAAH